MNTDLRGKRFSILGAARSGLAVAGLLRGHGAEVFVSDSAPAEKLGGAKRELETLGVPCEFGGHSDRVLEAATVVVSPGIPSDAPIVRRAVGAGRNVVSELEVASWFCPGPIVGITGTNGKTTTTALAGRMFEDARVPSVESSRFGVWSSRTASGSVRRLT